ncbi:hypothetical protein L249_5212 [Ophiocordyceps polyrhachis-furcata BCC 54312]|uniref:Uncharacterized protein n=1 Tax=Ophiocordyceps polyrhachis-furcata BCC 54312 TaxID=1330021 RepID=A0A367L9H1_9HYPO|nr:hypothetical protein L249_5212 [Ophiocordyceps polyrhachis-furcata BCC 54312]
MNRLPFASAFNRNRERKLPSFVNSTPISPTQPLFRHTQSRPLYPHLLFYHILVLSRHTPTPPPPISIPISTTNLHAQSRLSTPTSTPVPCPSLKSRISPQ